MKESFLKLLRSLSQARGALAPALVIILLGATAPRLAGQSYNFDGANDTGWTHYSMQKSLTGGNNPIPPNYVIDTITFTNGYYCAPSFTFPADPNGGYHYRIQTPGISYDYWILTPDYPTYGYGAQNSRGASYPANIYSNQFLVGVDLVAWNANFDQYVGLATILNNIGLGTSDGYATTLNFHDKSLEYDVFASEVPTTIGESPNGGVVLNPTHQYRLVASSYDGVNLLFQLFDKSQPTNSPSVSCVCQGGSLFGTSGYCGLLVYNGDGPPPENSPGANATAGTDATFDNYAASAPAAGQNPSLWPATVTDLSPLPGGQTTSVSPTVRVGIVNRETSVDTNTIVLYLDGTLIPNASLTITNDLFEPNNPSSGPGLSDFPGATATYAIPTQLPPGTRHTNACVFTDIEQSIVHSNYWTWTSPPELWASNSLPAGSLSVPGFDARMVHSTAAGMGGNNFTDTGADIQNTVAGAMAVLAGQYPVDYAATNWVQLVAWALNGSDNGAMAESPAV